VEKYGRPSQATDNNILLRIKMRFACCIPKATDTHSQYRILIAFPVQQWLRERASMLRYTYITCLVMCTARYEAKNTAFPPHILFVFIYDS
jgi:hypothetical protein